jgi:hypothetical protein
MASTKTPIDALEDYKNTGNFDVSGTLTAAGSTLSATEMAYLDGVTAGTAAASKALVLGASSEIATISAATITKISHGATPVPAVDFAGSTITAAAGAANVSTVTVTLKDGAGTALARRVPFRVYKSSASDGLTLGAAASTGWSVASGGLSLANGTAVTTQITAMSSASGACVLSLTDTNKATDYLVLVVGDGTKISAQLSAGSYG